MASAFVNLVLIFCGLFASYYVVTISLLMWSLCVGTIGGWLVVGGGCGLVI